MRGMDLTRRGPRPAALVGSGLLCAVLLAGCAGGSAVQRPAVVCPAGRELRDLTSVTGSTATIADVNEVDLLMRQSRAPSELSSDWKTTAAFMQDANTQLQALADPADEAAFEVVWTPLSTELESTDSDLGRSVQAIVTYTDEHCSATALPTYSR